MVDVAFSLRKAKFQFYSKGPKYVFLLIWLFFNVFLFSYDYYNFDTKAKFSYLRDIIGAGLPFARASAACLNLNCALIILCVCRNLLSLIHNSQFCPRVIRRLINHNLALHKLCAWSIVFHTIIHTLAHTYNVEFAISYFNREDAVVGGLLTSTYASSLFLGTKDTAYTILFGSVGGLTGVILDLVLFIMVTSSIKIVRRSFFEVFWFTHHLFIVFYICLVSHATGQMIKGQTNPYCVVQNGTNWCNYLCNTFTRTDLDLYQVTMCDDEEILFKGPGYTNWQKSYFWVGIPAILYIIDRAVRWSRRFNPAVVYKAIMHEGPCLELRMRKSGWKQEAGQYVFIQCSDISLFEWHPFTLTSAPEEDYLSVHIRKAGDWTTALYKVVEKRSKEKTVKEGKNTELHMQLAIDGPYGTPSDDIFRYKASILIGAGVGCTPYASILKSVWYKIEAGDYDFGTKKIYFYWLCSNVKVFEWLRSQLKEILEKLEALDSSDFLEVRLHLTRFDNDTNMMQNVALHMDSKEDAITELPNTKTQFGRPNWFKDFVEIGEHHPVTDIGVFFCGPGVLSETLDESCTLANAELDKRDTGSMFFYNKENF